MQTAGDGYLDSHELPPALYGLLNYDANGDGRISAAEYLGALRQVQLEMSLDQQYASPPPLPPPPSHTLDHTRIFARDYALAWNTDNYLI
jgi:hypothetical protein